MQEKEPAALAAKPYKKDGEYSYTLGPFPTFELLRLLPGQAQQVYISPRFNETQKLMELCREKNVPCCVDEKNLNRLSNKEICFAACRFGKYACTLQSDAPHVVLVNPGDMGNLGTILRTLLAFGIKDLAIIEPCADIFHPKTVRASMGAIFHMRFAVFQSFDDYLAQNPGRDLFPFMLTGKEDMSLSTRPQSSRYSLIFGNESTGLPPEFANLGRTIFIPQSPEVDSLNLAISVAVGAFVFSQMHTDL